MTRPRRLVRACAARGALAAIAAAACAGVVWAAVPTAGPGEWNPPGDIAADPTALVPGDVLRDHLGGIDYVPSRAALDPLLGDAPTTALIELATADSVDPGVRLRALRALAQYPGDAAAATLTDVIDSLRASKSGTDLLHLAAAMTSLAMIAGDDAIETIRPVLDHTSKDARAAAARALGATGAKKATPWLYERLGVETDEMVRLALSDAIRALGENQQ